MEGCVKIIDKIGRRGVQGSTQLLIWKVSAMLAKALHLLEHEVMSAFDKE